MKKLMKISFAISLIGIIILLILSSIEPSLSKIKNINKNLLNKKIQIQGQVVDVKNYNDFQILTIKDETGKIEVTTNKNLDLENKNIKVIGRIKEYKGKLQIESNKIILL